MASELSCVYTSLQNIMLPTRRANAPPCRTRHRGQQVWCLAATQQAWGNLRICSSVSHQGAEEGAQHHDQHEQRLAAARQALAAALARRAPAHRPVARAHQPAAQLRVLQELRAQRTPEVGAQGLWCSPGAPRGWVPPSRLRPPDGCAAPRQASREGVRAAFKSPAFQGKQATCP